MSAPQISRRQAWCKLAILIAEGLPDPSEIYFTSGGNVALRVQLDTAAALKAWAAVGGCTLSTPHLNSATGSWIHTADGDWCGYRFALTAYVKDEPVADGMAAVRAIADETTAGATTDAAPAAGGEAFRGAEPSGRPSPTTPGDGAAPMALLAAEEVAGSDGWSGSATAPAPVELEG